MEAQTGVRSLTGGSVRRSILSFVVPIFLSQLFQQLYNTADSLIVGNILGRDALAAVSSSSPLLELLTSLISGVALGAGVVISRSFGAGEHENVHKAIHTLVLFALLAGIFLTVFGVLLSPYILVWMGTAPSVLAGSISYFRCFFFGCTGMVLYNAFMGIMNALGDSRRPLYYLLFSSAVNILLDLLFVGVFRWGVGAAAVATAISQALSACLCFLHLTKPDAAYRLQLSALRLHPALFREILRLGLPSGVQNSVISIANVLIQSYINSFGANATAACGAFSKLEGFAFLPITSFSMAMMTFISQNLGAREYRRARQGARFGIVSCVVLAETIGLIMLLAAPRLMALFGDEPEVLAIGVRRMHIETLFFGLLAFSHCVAGICRGAGRAAVPMLVMLAVWCLFRIAYITVIMRIRHEIDFLFWAYPLTWTISSVVFLIYYLKSDWLHGFEHR